MAIKFHKDERYVTLPLKKTPNGNRYAITNYGRIVSYTTIVEEGSWLKNSNVKGYPVINLHVGEKSKTFPIHRLVAIHFVQKPVDKAYNTVIHINFNKEDNHYHNLKWVTKEQCYKHVSKQRRAKDSNAKLTEARVKMIKRKLLNGKTRLKMIAKQFGVSDMQIHRIKTGENWGYVKID